MTLFKIKIVCVCVRASVPTSVLCTLCVQVPTEDMKGIRFLQASDTEGCAPPDVGAVN